MTDSRRENGDELEWMAGLFAGKFNNCITVDGLVCTPSERLFPGRGDRESEPLTLIALLKF